MLCSPLGAYFTAHRSTCIAFSSNFLTSLYHMSLQKQHSTLRKYTYIIRIQSLDFQYTMGSKKSETTSENPIFHYKLCYQNKQFKLKSELKNQHDYEKTFVPLFALMAAAFKLYELHKFVYNLIIMFSRMIQKAS